jgi:hypothetical protein
MRTLIVSIVSFLITFNFLSAQQSKLALFALEATVFKNTSFSDDTPKLIPINSDYLKKSSSRELPNIVKSWKSRLVNYNLKTSVVFDDSEKSTYQITYKNKQVNILAIYNNNGKLLSTKETYKNIKLPLALRIRISKTYPNYAFVKNIYHTKYNYKTGVSKDYYIVQIDNGKYRKSIKYNGNLISH